MKATKEQIKQEAVARMKLLNLHPNVINEFQNEGKLNYSEGTLGILYWATDEMKQIVESFENKTGYTVYHLIDNNSELIGHMLTLLYVSTERDEWTYDRRDILNDCPLAYVENMTYPDCSEFGSVGVRPANGGVVRTA